MKISEIEPIHYADEQIDRGLQGTRNCIVTREELKKIVERPCLEATLVLYDKNIRTTSTDANKNSIGFNGHISISLSSLSEENRATLKSLYPIEYESALSNPDGDFTLEVPIREDSTVEEISEAFCKMVENLKIQDVLYGNETLEHFAGALMPIYAEEGDTIADMINWVKDYSTMEWLKEQGELSGLEYIDEETGTLWATKELYDKHMQYLMRKKEDKTPLQQKEEELSLLEVEAKTISEAEALINQQKEGQNIGED